MKAWCWLPIPAPMRHRPRLHLPQDARRRGERFFALLTAGSLTQGVMSLLGEWLDTGDPEKDLWAIGSMFAAAQVVTLAALK